MSMLQLFNLELINMARKKEQKEVEEKSKFDLFSETQEETLRGVFAVISLVFCIFFTLSAFGLSGRAGVKIFDLFISLFGVGYFLVPLFFLLLSLSFLKNLKQDFTLGKIASATFSFFSSLGIVSVLFPDQGGLIGKGVSTPLVYLFAPYASLVFLVGILVISLIFLFNARIDDKLQALWDKMTKKKELSEEELAAQEEAEEEFHEETDEEIEKKIQKQEDDESPAPAVASKAEEKKKEMKLKIQEHVEEEFIPTPQKQPLRETNYVPIPLDLLEVDRGKPGVGDIKANANIIKRTLQNFGIDVEMDEISIGPSVTRYALKPAEGVKLSKIVALQDDLSLALAAHPIRIEAPIPGKSLVGIEIPNTTKTTVGLGSLLSNQEFQSSDKPLLTALGKGISGKAHFGNLAKMPHLLVAGTTGSGKSVTIHSLIVSLLYRNSPDNLRFILIDPKRVELTLYNKIPHLQTPVITDPKKTIMALRWAVKEMERRYEILQDKSVTNIESYHKNVLEPVLKRIKENPPKEGEIVENAPDRMPYIVIVIDELADIMQTYPRELEAGIVRLAQMSRAVGIHLILSTQRPSVNVITGLIKANIPSRLALQVASQVDSRTILDQVGAEQLLGAGDMLYLSADMSKPQRLQSAYVSEAELKAVVKFLAENYEDYIPVDITEMPEKDKNSIFESSFGDEGGEDDDMYEDARQVVLEAGKASTSYIQRKLRVGYARAARLMDLLEERGVIGPADGSKPRSVIGDHGGGDTDEAL
jgi:S-DNA-T family DNA segregation ATPase FtsK/SpoIIIE